MSAADRIFQHVMRLPGQVRAKLMARLAETLEGPDPHAHLDDDALLLELERRADAAASGRTKGVPWHEVQHRVFGKRKR